MEKKDTYCLLTLEAKIFVALRASSRHVGGGTSSARKVLNLGLAGSNPYSQRP